MTIEWNPPLCLEMNAPFPRAYGSKCERASVTEYVLTSGRHRFEIDAIYNGQSGISWPFSGRPAFDTLEAAGEFVEKWIAEHPSHPLLSPFVRWDKESRAAERAHIIAWLRDKDGGMFDVEVGYIADALERGDDREKS